VKNFNLLHNTLRRLHQQKSNWLVYGLPFVVGLVLAWVNLGQSAIWSGDAGFHLGTVLQTWRSGEVVGYGPPSGTLFWRYPSQFSYFFTLPHWLSGGSGLIVIGWMGLLTATLIPTLTWLGERLFGNRWLGLAWGVLVFFNPVGIESARSFSNPNVVLFALPCFLLIALAVEQRKAGAIWLLGLLAGLLGTLHVFTFYIMLVTPLWLWRVGQTPRDALQLMGKFLLGMGITFVPFVLVEWQNNLFALQGFWFDVTRVSGAGTSRLEMLYERLGQFFALYQRLFGGTVGATIALLFSGLGVFKLTKASSWNAPFPKTRLLVIVLTALGVGQFFVFSGLIWPWYFTILWVFMPLLVVLGMHYVTTLSWQWLRSDQVSRPWLPAMLALLLALPNFPTLHAIIYPGSASSPADHYTVARQVAKIIADDADGAPFRFHFADMPSHQGSFEYFWALDQTQYNCDVGNVYVLTKEDALDNFPASCLETPLPTTATGYKLYRSSSANCRVKSITPHFDFDDIRTCHLHLVEQ